MTEEAAERLGSKIGSGIAWLGFWLMIGLTNFQGCIRIKN